MIMPGADLKIYVATRPVAGVLMVSL